MKLLSTKKDSCLSAKAASALVNALMLGCQAKSADRESLELPPVPRGPLELIKEVRQASRVYVPKWGLSYFSDSGEAHTLRGPLFPFAL